MPHFWTALFLLELFVLSFVVIFGPFDTVKVALDLWAW
jgi:hypothetical protein